MEFIVFIFNTFELRYVFDFHCGHTSWGDSIKYTLAVETVMSGHRVFCSIENIHKKINTSFLLCRWVVIYKWQSVHLSVYEHVKCE